MLEAMAGRAIETKIKAMYGKRLKKADFDEMLRRRTVGEIAGYLKNETHYGDALANIQESSIHRGQLESMLQHSLYKDVMRLKKYAKLRHGLFDCYQISLEIQQLIRLLGCLEAGRARDYLLDMPGWLLGRLSIDLSKLSYSKDETGLLNALKGTRYEKLFARLMEENGGKLPSTTLCATQLERFYYQQLFLVIGREYKGAEAEELRQMVRLQIEGYNVAAVYRLKMFFDAAPGQIDAFLLNGFGAMSRRRQQRLIKAQDAGDFIAFVRDTKRGRKLGREAFDFIEYANRAMAAQDNRKRLAFTVSPAAAFLAFLSLRQLELRNLVNTIEGVRYQLPPEEIRSLLILNP